MNTQTIERKSTSAYMRPGLIITSGHSRKSKPVCKVTKPDLKNVRGSIEILWPAANLDYAYSIDGVNYDNRTGLFDGLMPGAYNVTYRNTITGTTSEPTTELIPRINLTDAICDTFGIDKELLESKCRKTELVYARHCMSYVLCILYGMGPSMTASRIPKGDKMTDHATVIHSCKTFENLCDTDKQYRAKAELIIRAFNENILTLGAA